MSTSVVGRCSIYEAIVPYKITNVNLLILVLSSIFDKHEQDGIVHFSQIPLI